MKGKVINIIKEIAFFAINWLRKVVYWVCILFPIKNNRIYVNVFDGRGFGDNPKYIIKKLWEMNPEIEVIWIYSGNSKVDRIKYVQPFSFYSIYYQATSKIWISTVRMPYYSIKRPRQIYIQTWHGSLGFKKCENECPDALSDRYIRTAKHDSKMIDYYMSANDDNTKLFREKFWYAGGVILKVGAARNDIFFDGSLEIKKIIKKKFDAENCKLAVYAPTFRKENSLKIYNIEFNKLLNNLEKYWGGEWKIVIRLHPRIANMSGKLLRYDENIKDGSQIDDVQELLVAADLLITDYSSIVFDYMSTNNPILLYAPDIEEYKKERDFHILLDDTPFTICRNNEELEQKIKNFDLKKYRHDMTTFKFRFGWYEEGHASQKIAELICNKIAENVESGEK